MNEFHIYTALSLAISVYGYTRLRSGKTGWTERLWVYVVWAATVCMVSVSILILIRGQ